MERLLIKTGQGSFEIETSQDRKSSFEPEIIKKRQTKLADSLSDKTIGLYKLGMSYRDICSHIKEMYDTDISTHILQGITIELSQTTKLGSLEGLTRFIALYS